MSVFRFRVPSATVAWRTAVVAVLVSPLVGYAQGRGLSVEPSPVARISSLGGLRDGLGRVAGAAFDRSGALILADGSTSRIGMFGRDGRLIKSVGRTGAGPGEFEGIEWVGWCGDDAILVFELGTSRFTVLDHDLRYVRSFRTPGSSTAHACGADGRLAYLQFALDSQPAAGRTWRGVASLWTIRLGEPAPRGAGWFPLADMARVGGTWMVDAGGRRTTLAAGEGEVVVATGDDQPLFIVPTDGAPVRRIGVPARVARQDSSTRWFAADEFASRLPDRELRERVARQIVSASSVKVDVHYRRIVRDRAGLLWLQRSLGGGGSLDLEAVDGNGSSVMRVTLPLNGELLAVGDDRLAVHVLTDDGAPEVWLFAIRR